MTSTTDELVRIAWPRATAAAANDFATTVATLEADPVSELRPMGVALRGRGTERHPVMAVLTFGNVAPSGERLFASDRLRQLLFGPTLALAAPLP